ncbi:hypothetical protein [Nostoc sp. TCL240-02]|uniref:hypothetical protein n=1 Tax=Nostoc sp. TCL240-02 TaxID=2572090 RepID=UPI00157FB188|nr:hypothetical protein [Nostoc sp. TCL240-02]QKQ75561.1 hypothetical protein FBB35_21755 [Nostoc sp. TCL240-02]
MQFAFGAIAYQARGDRFGGDNSPNAEARIVRVRVVILYSDLWKGNFPLAIALIPHLQFPQNYGTALAIAIPPPASVST